MSHIVLLLCTVSLVGAVLAYLLIPGRKLSSLSGWRFIVAGCALIFLGKVIELTGQFPLLARYVVIGPTEAAALIQQGIGFFGGFLSLTVGITRLILAALAGPKQHRLVVQSLERMITRQEQQSRRLRVLESELQRAYADWYDEERRIIEEQSRFRMILDCAGEAIITTDTAGIVQYLNPAAEALTGWSLNKAQGLPLHKVFRVVDELTRERLPNLVDQCLRGGQVIGLPEHALLLSRAGSEYAVQDSLAPLRDANGETRGIVLVFNDVTEARRMAWQMTYHATHDDLTGLLNRREFERRLRRTLEQARLNHSRHALCYLDLDQFKVINDTCGHLAGDEMLRQIAQLLKSRIRKLDTLARLGGDEFAVLLESCSLDQARRVADEVREAVEDYRFTWEDRPFGIGVSIGLVAITPASEDITNVLRAADGACYAAKEKGRNRIHVVHKEDDTALVKRRGEMQWMFMIPWALEEGRFQLDYQPIAPIGSVKENGHHYELLIRMVDANGDIVPPGAFLLAAERYNLIAKLDRWVISTAFEWLLAHPKHLRQLHLCEINLSGFSLGNEGFLDFVTSQFRDSQVPPEKICFEITETAAISNLASATHFMKSLRDLGCQFALDDFGSGLSSFAYLKNLPVDLLKIDGMFVKDIVGDPLDLALVKSINDIGKVMGLKTVAEFVENDDILVKLRGLGVDYAQGYAIGQPRSLEELN